MSVSEKFNFNEAMTKTGEIKIELEELARSTEGLINEELKNKKSELARSWESNYQTCMEYAKNPLEFENNPYALHQAILIRDEALTKQILQTDPSIANKLDEKGRTPLDVSKITGGDTYALLSYMKEVGVDFDGMKQMMEKVRSEQYGAQLEKERKENNERVARSSAEADHEISRVTNLYKDKERSPSPGALKQSLDSAALSTSNVNILPSSQVNKNEKGR